MAPQDAYGAGGKIFTRAAAAFAALAQRHPPGARAASPRDDDPPGESPGHAAPQFYGRPRGLLGGLRAVCSLPSAIGTAISTVSFLGGGREAAAATAVQALAGALRPQERLPTLDAGTAGTRVLWQAMLSNYSPSALRQAQQAQEGDEAGSPCAGRDAEHQMASGDTLTRHVPVQLHSQM